MREGRKFLKVCIFVLGCAVVSQSCDNSDDCTRIDKIGGGLLREREIEMACDFPEAEPIGIVKH